MITEQADLRSWQTLPQNLQVARIPLPEGNHQLTFAVQGKNGRKIQERAFNVDIGPGEEIFVSARSGTWDLIGFDVFQVGTNLLGVDQGYDFSPGPVGSRRMKAASNPSGLHGHKARFAMDLRNDGFEDFLDSLDLPTEGGGDHVN